MKSGWVWVLVAGAIMLALGGGVALSMTVSPLIQKFANAIANAEGFQVVGSIPNRNNNPGDITDPATGSFMSYATPDDGWNALYSQVSAMFSGTSRYYNPSMTISQVAQIYSPDGWLNWANNVASYLGVSTDTTLNDLQGGA